MATFEPNKQESRTTRRMDRVDSNPTAVDFRNRLRKITTPRPPEEQASRSNFSNSFLDEKTREMIQERFRNRHVLPPPRIATNVEEKMPEDDDDSDPDLEGYDSFFQTLQNEVHGQHSLVSAAALI